MLKPEEVNESNVDQAIEQMVTELRKLITETRRIDEVSTALFNRTGNHEDLKAALQARNVVIELDAALAELLKGTLT